jgi:hypothetical protein
MSVDPAHPPADDRKPTRRAPDAAHLDEDPEALEDPVHRGDAQHQHAAHGHHTAHDDHEHATPPPEPPAGGAG